MQQLQHIVDWNFVFQRIYTRSGLFYNVKTPGGLISDAASVIFLLVAPWDILCQWEHIR